MYTTLTTLTDRVTRITQCGEKSKPLYQQQQQSSWQSVEVTADATEALKWSTTVTRGSIQSFCIFF